MTEVLEKADAAVTMNVKEQLSYLHVEKKNLFDAAIAMYLLNPLKDTYAYEDIAKNVWIFWFRPCRSCLEKKILDRKMRKE